MTRVNIPQNLGGKNRGFAFIDFETKEQAEKAAEEMNNTKFRSQVLTVETSKESKVKATARSYNPGRSSESPAPSTSRDQEGDQVMGDAAPGKPSHEDITARTIALMNLPDTVNDARVRALVDPLGEVVKMTLQPAHGGAKIEFVDASAAGKAALKLDGMEFEGRKLRTGPAAELRNAKADNKPLQGQKSAGNKPAFMPQQTIRRPMIGKAGPKRGLGFAPKKPSADAAARDDDKSGSNGQSTPKSNADFKVMFLAGKQAPSEDTKKTNGAKSSHDDEKEEVKTE